MRRRRGVISIIKKIDDAWIGISEFIRELFHKGFLVKRYSKDSEIRELQKLYERIEIAYQRSDFASVEIREHLCRLVIHTCKLTGHDLSISINLLTSFAEAGEFLYESDGFDEMPGINWEYVNFNHHDILQLRKYLHRLGNLYDSDINYFEVWSEMLKKAFYSILKSIPRGIDFDNQHGTIQVELVNLLTDVNECVQYLLACILAEEYRDAGFFLADGEIAYTNLLKASGRNPDGQTNSNKPLIFPNESKLNGKDLVEAYLGETVFGYLLTRPYPFEIPKKSRFEHCHILGGTGHGKTQLIQTLILEDLKKHNERGLLVIDSQGDLIKKLTMNHRFAADSEDSLAEKLILIDPTDVEYPVCLNMFALNKTDVEGVSPADKEMIINSTIELYSYMFGALFGAELTQRQGLIFQYLARLMMQIPDATIQTLREMLENGRKFMPYMDELSGSTQAFFKTQFFSTQFNQTKRQVLTRLWSILSNTTLERLFSHSEQKVDLYEAMNSGKIVLINTAKDLLGKEGSQILGRFFIALLSQAIIKRSAIPETERLPFYVYIDEAHEYFDENIEQLLNQARKYKVGLTLSHQNLGQLNSSLRATVMSSTSIKLAGGVSSDDAFAIAKETRSTKEAILAARKRDDHTEFVGWIKNTTESPLVLSVPFGLLEQEPVLSEEAFMELIESNRAKYCLVASKISVSSHHPAMEVAHEPQISTTSQEERTDVKPEPKRRKKTTKTTKVKSEEVTTPEIEKPVSSEGKGGTQHRYLQNLIKKIAQERGYKADIEQQVLGGKGSIDVAIEGHGEKVACEITVTTNYSWEVQNFMKCLAAGYDKVFAVSSDSKKLNGLRRFAQERITEELDDGRVLFFDPPALISYLDQKRAESASEKKTVRGYSVKVNYSAVSSEEEKSRREAIAKIILKSSQKL